MECHLIVTQTVNTYCADISLKLSDCEEGCHIWVNTVNVLLQTGDRGSTVVKALRYNSESWWFDPSWCHWNFSLT